MNAPSVQPEPLHLVLGDEELLVERAVLAAANSARLVDPNAELNRVRVTEVTAGEFDQLLSPTLFADGRVVSLEGAQEASSEVADAILGHAKQADPGLTLIIVHSGGGRSKGAKDLPKALRKAGAHVTECTKITRPSDREAFVRSEAKRAGGRINAGGVTALIETVGSDLRELSAATSQLIADCGGSVDENAVRRYYQGRAEVTGFVVADKTIVGDQAAALEALRWALRLGVAHVLLADALADTVRTATRVASAGTSDQNRLASELGVPPWKAKKGVMQARGWSTAALGDAVRICARLNADVKGGAADASYAVETAIRRITSLRASRK